MITPSSFRKKTIYSEFLSRIFYIENNGEYELRYSNLGGAIFYSGQHFLIDEKTLLKVEYNAARLGDQIYKIWWVVSFIFFIFIGMILLIVFSDSLSYEIQNFLDSHFEFGFYIMLGIIFLPIIYYYLFFYLPYLSRMKKIAVNLAGSDMTAELKRWLWKRHLGQVGFEAFSTISEELIGVVGSAKAQLGLEGLLITLQVVQGDSDDEKNGASIPESMIYSGQI